MPRRLVSPLPVWVPKPSNIALDLEAKNSKKNRSKTQRATEIAQNSESRAGNFQGSLVTSGEVQAREQVARGGRRRLRRRGELEAVAEGSSIGRHARLATQPPLAAPRRLREDDDASDGDSCDDPDARVGDDRPAASRATRLPRGGHRCGGGVRRLGF